MSSSGLFSFNPIIAEIIDEAFERIGKDPASLVGRHMRSARRSIEYVLTHWNNATPLQWTLDLQSQALTQGLIEFTPPAGTIDITRMVLRRDGEDTPMSAMSKNEYLELNDKTQQGRPDRYVVMRTITPTVNIWTASENDTDLLIYWRIRQIQDGGGAQNTLDIPHRFREAFTASLAAKLSEKFAPDREKVMVAKAISLFSDAKLEDRDRATVAVDVDYD